MSGAINNITRLFIVVKWIVAHGITRIAISSLVFFFSCGNYINFRAIMEALANIGHVVKATQFIGQSSG